jgi:hypothetical protein
MESVAAADYIKKMNTIANYLQEPQNELVEQVTKWFPEIDSLNVMCNVIKNQSAWIRFRYQVEHISNGSNFLLLSDALGCMLPKSLVLYFADLGIYRVYDDIHCYYRYCKDILKIYNDDNNVQEVTLSTQSHKLIVVTDKDSVEAIRGYIKSCFNSNSIVVQNGDDFEITALDTNAIGKADSWKLYNNLYDHIYNKQPMLARQMRPLTFKNYCMQEIRMSKIRNFNKNDSYDNWLSVLGSNRIM